MIGLIDVAYDAAWLYGLCDADWCLQDGLLTIESSDHVLLVWYGGWRHMEYNGRGSEVRCVTGVSADGLLAEMERF